MRTAFVIIIGSFLFATSCLAETIVTVRTVGAKPCSVWSRDNEDKFSWPAITDRNWFAGFMSGIAVGASNDFLRNVDVLSLVAWIDHYCEKNPLKFADEGVYILACKLVPGCKLTETQPLTLPPSEKFQVPLDY